MPGFMPRLSNHRPVPAILPPPKMWLMPWASITAPSPHRSTSRARLIESRSSIAGQRTGIDRAEGPSVRSAPMPSAKTVAKVLGVITAATAGALAVQGGEEADRRQPRARRGPISSSSRNARSAAMAGIGAKAGGQYALHRARKVFASAERQAELDAAFELQTAEGIAEALGNMKGAMMKLGQMASYLDQGLPEPVRQALAELQANAPPMSAELAAQVVARGAGRRARGGCSRSGTRSRSRRRRSARCTAPSPTTGAPSP